MTDTYKCEICGYVFTEWQMNYKYASEHGKCLCYDCILREMESTQEVLDEKD